MFKKEIILRIINPKKFFGLVKEIEKKGMHYFIELNNDNTLKYIGSKDDGSIQFRQVYNMSDILVLEDSDYTFSKIMFEFSFEKGHNKLLDHIIKNSREVKIKLILSNENSFYFAHAISGDNEFNFNTKFKQKIESQIQKVNEYLKLLPKEQEKPLLEFTLQHYIMKMNLIGNTNDLKIFLFKKELGHTIVFSDGNYNLQIIDEFTTTMDQFFVQINSKNLRQLEKDDYTVKVFKNYLQFITKNKESQTYIIIEEFQSEDY